MTHQPATAFLSIGFRPFYLGAAVFAAISVPLWIHAYLSGVPLPTAYPAYLWHMHEMPFGFGVAVIAGFLLTAVRNWTARATPSGRALGTLFAIWMLGRLTAFAGSGVLFALTDSAFLPVLAVCLAIPLWRARNSRNAFVIVVLAALWFCNLAFHAAALGVISGTFAVSSITVAADVVLLLMVIIGGRVIPAFSANAVPGLKPRTWRVVEAASVGFVVLIIAMDAASPWVRFESVLGAVVYAACGVHLLRLVGWQPWRTRHNVLLLVLPLSYLWIPVHLLLRGWQGAMPGMLMPVSAHALFVGAMAGLMLSMMTRSALGHTGRPLRAGWAETLCFLCIQLAAIFRVAGPWAPLPETQSLAMILSAALWSLAFGTFAISYAPKLIGVRVDDRSAAPG